MKYLISSLISRYIVDKRSENEKGRKTKEKRPVSTLVQISRDIEKIQVPCPTVNDCIHIIVERHVQGPSTFYVPSSSDVSLACS